MQNLTAATATLDPRVILQMLGGADEESAGAGGRRHVGRNQRGIAAGFDDFKVAQLLATTLAIDGQASERLAGVFDTIAPDEPRKRRVLTMTRTLLSETSFGQTEPVPDVVDLDGRAAARLQREAVRLRPVQVRGSTRSACAPTRWRRDIPEELVALIETLGQDNVRRLSVALLVDLLQARAESGARAGARARRRGARRRPAAGRRLRVGARS